MPLLTQDLSKNPSIRTYSPGASLTLPSIRREDVGWTGGAGGAPFRLELVFENSADRPSAPVSARVEVAAFGAFLPWSPLLKVAVPPIPPGCRRVVTATAGRDWDMRREETPPLPLTSGVDALLGRLPDLMMLGRSSVHLQNGPHFVGNLNVFVTGRKPVERHLQRSVGLRPGRDNLAIFSVGDRTLDRYTFAPGAKEAGWEVSMPGVVWGSPVELRQGHLTLCIKPPANARTGRVSVLVRRESTGHTVPVEFELEAVAPGSRCYSL